MLVKVHCGLTCGRRVRVRRLGNTTGGAVGRHLHIHTRVQQHCCKRALHKRSKSHSHCYIRHEHVSTKYEYEMMVGMSYEHCCQIEILQIRTLYALSYVQRTRFACGATYVCGTRGMEHTHVNRTVVTLLYLFTHYVRPSGQVCRRWFTQKQTPSMSAVARTRCWADEGARRKRTGTGTAKADCLHCRRQGSEHGRKFSVKLMK